MATLTLTTGQEEIIGYALRLAIRDQKAKLGALLTAGSEATGKTFVTQVDGHYARIAQLEDAYNALPVEA